MNSMSAFAMGEANRDKELMVFDWDQAARRINEVQPKEALAGLANDYEWTQGTIYQGGGPDFDGYTYLASTWATPMLEMDGVDEPCFKMQSELPEWGSGTKWPTSALAILSK